MEGVTIVDHPLVQHKLTLIRDKSISTKSFRELLKEIGMLLCYEVTRDLPLAEVVIETRDMVHVQEIMARWPRTELFVIVDHEGKLALDAAAYFMGHGFENVRCLRGGIDAWSQEVDTNVPRYQLA